MKTRAAFMATLWIIVGSLVVHAQTLENHSFTDINHPIDDAAANGDIHYYREISTPTAGLPLTGTWQPDGRWVDPDEALDSSARTATLSQFIGSGASGEWTLFLADLEAGGTNMLVSWNLELSGIATPAMRVHLWRWLMVWPPGAQVPSRMRSTRSRLNTPATSI
jgi:hypothetical protein